MFVSLIMKTRHTYIYLCRPVSRQPYYLVRFRNNEGQYVQHTFGNSKNPSEALKRAIIWRDKNLPPNRKIHSRHLLIKPLRNKTTDLPAGITFTSYTKKLKSGIRRYYFFMVTAGWNTKGKVIVKKVHITQNRSYAQALRLAKQVRKELASDYGKQFINK